MDEQVNMRMAAVFWSITGALAVGLCVVAGVYFGQTSLWGASAAATTLYIGSIGIWFSRRGSSKIASKSNKRLQISGQPVPSAIPTSLEATYAKGIAMKVGSPEFSDLIHNLAEQVDEPTDIIDIARRAGIRMSSLRSSGSQSPLSLWTTVVTQAVRDGKVERLIAEAY